MKEPTIQSLDDLMDKIIEKAQDLTGKSDLALIEDLTMLDSDKVNEDMEYARERIREENHGL